jgi:hypothetical protein
VLSHLNQSSSGLLRPEIRVRIRVKVKVRVRLTVGVWFRVKVSDFQEGAVSLKSVLKWATET